MFVRAPLAHGRILAVGPAAAARLPGVAGVFTAADLALPPMPAGGAPAAMARPVLATDTVRFLAPRPRPRSTKGIGESGTIGATPAVQNAVMDPRPP